MFHIKMCTLCTHVWLLKFWNILLFPSKIAKTYREIFFFPKNFLALKLALKCNRFHGMIVAIFDNMCTRGKLRIPRPLSQRSL